MINLNWEGMAGEVGAMMARFNALPRHIAKKHLLAVVKRVGREGVPKLKANTPVGRKMKANAKGVVKMRRSGDLRRAATTNAKYKGRNRDGSVTGTIGYRYGIESRKAIWLEYGTTKMAARGMVARTMQSWGGPATAKLVAEMAIAFEKAVKELESGMNPGTGYRRVK